MIMFEWLNAQLLKMEWLSNLVTFLVNNIFGLDVNSRIGGSIHFFIYDVIKIFILLSVLIFAISYIQSFFPPERTKKFWVDLMGYGPIYLVPYLVQLHPFVPVHLYHYS